jgi:glycosyltransferase involved in cell wall biosynthesis
VSSARAGVVVPPENPEAIADAMRMLASMDKNELKAMGQRGSDFYNENMSMLKGVKDINNLLLEVVSK